MDQAAMQAWFRALPEREKIIFLVDLMWEFTLVIRSVFTDGDNDKSLKAAYSLSEFNHMLTSKVSAMLQGQPTYPDDLVFKVLFDKFSRPELESYMLIWHRLIERTKLRQSQRSAS
jgi:hypothetical protein